MKNTIIILFFAAASLFLLFAGLSFAFVCIRKRYKLCISSPIWLLFVLLSSLPVSFMQPLFTFRFTEDWEGNLHFSVFPGGDSVGTPLYSSGWLDHTMLQIVRYAFSALLFIWCLVALALFFRTVSGYFNSLHYLTSRSTECRDERLVYVFRDAVKKSRMLRKPVLRIADEGIRLSPCTAGFLSPAVIIDSEQAQMRSDQLEYIFLHELCHIRRHDFLVKLLALLATSFHFFAPFAREIRQAVYEDCELGCDKMVLSIVGEGRCGGYMRAILAIAEQRVKGRQELELLNFAVSAKELLMQRYKALITPVHAPVRAGILLGAAIISTGFWQLLFFSAADVSGLENPYVHFTNPYLADVVSEYYGMETPEDLTTEHLADIYCLEFSLSDLIYKENREEFPFAANKYPLRCTVNEGKLLCDGVYLDAVMPGTLAFTEMREEIRYICSVDIVPIICRRDTLTKYLPEGRAEQQDYLAQYTLADATEEALMRYSSREYMEIISNHDLRPDTDDLHIRDVFEAYFREKNIGDEVFDDTYSGRLKEWYRDSITAISPCAEYIPLVFLSQSVSPQTMSDLIHHSYESGMLEHRLADRKQIATEDLAMFTGLRTVIFADGLEPEDPNVYTTTSYAVIVRSWWS